MAEASEVYKQIFDLNPFPMWIYDLETLNFLRVNQEAIHHYGYSEEEFLSMTIKDIRPSSEIEKLLRAVGKVRRREATDYDHLYVHRKKDGTIIHVKIKSRPVTFEGKDAELVTAIDLSDVYTSQQSALREKNYLEIIDRVNLIVNDLQRVYRPLEAFYAAAEFVGKKLNLHSISLNYPILFGDIKKWTSIEDGSPEKQNSSTTFETPLIGLLQDYKSPRCLFLEEIKEPNLRNYLEQQQLSSIVIMPLDKDPERQGFLLVEVRDSSRQWNSQEIKLIVSIGGILENMLMQDVKRKKLLESEMQFKTMVQEGTDLIAIIDAQGEYKYVSPTSGNVLGIEPEQFIGRNAFSFIHPDDAEALLPYLESAAQQPRITLPKYRFVGNDGEYRWLHTILTNQLGTSPIHGIIANSWDITEQVEIAERQEILTEITRFLIEEKTVHVILQKVSHSLSKLNGIKNLSLWINAMDRSKLFHIASTEMSMATSLPYDHWSQVIAREVGVVQKPVRWTSQKLSQRFPEFNNKSGKSFENLLGFPLMVKDEVIGVILVTSQLSFDKLEKTARNLGIIADQISPYIRQKITKDTFRGFFENSPDFQCILNFDLGFIKANKAFSKNLQYSTEYLNQKSFLNLVPEDERERCKDFFSKILRNRSPSELECNILNNNGEKIPLLINSIIPPEQDVIFVMAKNINALKTIEIRLQLAFNQLKRAQKIAKLGYWHRRLDQDISTWSDSTYAIYGQDRLNFIPTIKNIINLFHPEDRHLFSPKTGDNIPSQMLKSYEHRILIPGGSIKWIRQEIRWLLNEKGLPYMIEGTIQDISDTKVHEQELLLSNERFNLAFKASNEMIWELDFTTETIIRGTAYLKKFPYETSEPFSSTNSWNQLIAKEDQKRIWESLQKVLSTPEENYWKDEYKIILDDEDIAYVVDRCYIIKDEDGKPLKAVGSVLDVTESRKYLEKIKTHNKQLKEISWIQSHEFRAPIARIQGLLNMVKWYDCNDKSYPEVLDMIEKSVNELDLIVHKITQKAEIIK